MDVGQLAKRMEGWIGAEYRAVIFSDPDPIGYALFKVDPDTIYLRQLFIRRDRRRLGFGKRAFAILRDQIWPKDTRLTVEVLCANNGAVDFWHSLGYKDYALTLEIDPPTQ
jgi:GNAT superfamily N-acetyltransferase